MPWTVPNGTPNTAGCSPDVKISDQEAGMRGGLQVSKIRLPGGAFRQRPADPTDSLSRLHTAIKLLTGSCREIPGVAEAHIEATLHGAIVLSMCFGLRTEGSESACAVAPILASVFGVRQCLDRGRLAGAFVFPTPSAVSASEGAWLQVVGLASVTLPGLAHAHGVLKVASCRPQSQVVESVYRYAIMATVGADMHDVRRAIQSEVEELAYLGLASQHAARTQVVIRVPRSWE